MANPSPRYWKERNFLFLYHDSGRNCVNSPDVGDKPPISARLMQYQLVSAPQTLFHNEKYIPWGTAYWMWEMMLGQENDKGKPTCGLARCSMIDGKPHPKSTAYSLPLLGLVSQSLSTLSATTFQHLSACGRSHSLTETVYFASLSLFGLISSFHVLYSYIWFLSFFRLMTLLWSIFLHNCMLIHNNHK